MNALAFVDRYKAIRKQFYMPRPEAPDTPKTVPVARRKYVYLFPIGPVMPAYWMARSLSESMAAAQEIIESQKVLTVPRNKGMQIIREVCIKYNITVEDLISERRHQAIVIPRQEAMYRLCTETDWSLPRIGRMLGNRDHTTVLHGRRKFQKRLDAGEVTL